MDAVDRIRDLLAQIAPARTTPLPKPRHELLPARVIHRGQPRSSERRQFHGHPLNEAFATQGLAVLRDLGLADDDARVNANGGAIALGHPLGASGARLATTAINQLHRVRGRYALCTMCIGVGQGIAVILERV